MIAAAVIIFREVLEAAIIIGIVLAASKGIARRRRWVAMGVGAGLVGAVAVAFFADGISSLLEGMGQEVLNAAILGLAVLMLGWHNVWMGRHGRSLAAQMKKTGADVAEGVSPLSVLAVVCGLAVLREGSEVVLFLYGLMAGGDNIANLAIGSALGFVGGAAVGVGLYFGLLAIPLRYLFTTTAIIVLFLAGGLASTAAQFLVQADILPSLGASLWDSSAIISDRSIAGELLHIMIGYTARPMGIQLIAFIITIGVIGSLMIVVSERVSDITKKVACSVLVLLGVGSALLFLGGGTAHAGTTKVYSPIVEGGELEFESRGYVDIDKNDSKDGAQKQIYEVGYGFTNRWFSSLFAEFEKEPNETLRNTAVAWENIIQLTEQGAGFVDAGLYFEYAAATRKAGADTIEGKLLLEKQTGNFVHTANIIVEKPIGKNADESTVLGYAWRTKYRYRQALEFAVEAYGEFGEIRGFKRWSDQEHVVGPVILGKLNLGTAMNLKYEAGYLFGITGNSPGGRLKWNLELEVPL